MSIKKSLLFYLAAALFSGVSCSTTRYLHEGERLYTGASIKVLESDNRADKSLVEKTARRLLRPRPNKTFLGVPLKLWLYNIAGDSAAGGFRGWIRKTAGEPPVLMSSVNPDETARRIDTDLFNIGYFKSSTSFTIKESGRTAGVVYECDARSPYILDEIKYSIGDERLRRCVAAVKGNSLLKPGDAYNLEVVKKERERIDSALKENGYFYFNPDYLLFRADVDENGRRVDLELRIKRTIPPNALIPYRIGTIFINPDYFLSTDPAGIKKDTSIVDGVVFINASKIRPSVILRCLFLRKKDIYTRRAHSITLNRLITLGCFANIDCKFSGSDTGDPGVLNMHLLLTPMSRYTVGSELMIVDKSNDFAGLELNLSYEQRNTFGGAERLKVNLDGSFETQLAGKYKDLYSYQINPQADVSFPRLVIPFTAIQPTGFYIPRTNLSLSYGFLKRIDYFDLKTLRFSFGYTWKESLRKAHTLNPVNVDYTSIQNKSSRFNALLDSIPVLRKSYEEQFIAGNFYSFTFDERVVPRQKSRFYLNVTSELSGNALWMAQKIFSGKSSTAHEEQRFAGLIYSQFARATVEARNYLNLPNNRLFAVRLYSGIGKTYGNSTTLPYARQFFCGGPSSNRAFQINSVGPGTYRQSVQKSSAYSEIGGDIKVEGNVEYRWKISGIFNGAVFIDAGNDWLLKQDTVTDSRPFALDRFYRELAIGTGTGLRVDISFILLRLDLAMPLNKPWLKENERWTAGAINFGSPGWRRENLVLNFAIGYPF